MCCGVFIHNTTHPHANGISATITVTQRVAAPRKPNAYEKQDELKTGRAQVLAISVGSAWPCGFADCL